MISNSSQSDGKMIQDENIEETRVGKEVPLHFLKYFGGWKVIVLVIIIFCCFSTARILGEYQVGNWATSIEQ